jgi:hypothetical protein
MNQTDGAVSGLHDFDFLVGEWQAHHRKLKQRLVCLTVQALPDTDLASRSILNNPRTPFRRYAFHRPLRNQTEIDRIGYRRNSKGASRVFTSGLNSKAR